MRVAHLSLADFRNYRRVEVAFEPGHNLVVGRNGQGKTNLVEAIAYFASLRSHRVSGDAALIRAGSESAVVRMRVSVGDRDALLEAELNRSAPNRARVNRNAVRPRELTRWFSAVVFAPEDLLIVRGEPAVRRRFLDDALLARNPALAGVLGDYERVVRQRTSLLKSARANGAGSALDATLSVWDEQLVTLGSRIMSERRALVERLRQPLATGYAALVEQDHRPGLGLVETVGAVHEDDVSRETSTVDETRFADPSAPRAGFGREGVAEDTSIPVDDVTRAAEADAGHAQTVSSNDVSRETLESEFRAALERVRRQELERAVTLVGPHRDDLSLQLNGLPVKGYASHGESWSFTLSLKLALAELLRLESPAGDPAIILDDVFAELDEGRRERLMAAVGDYEQVVVTAAVESDVPSWPSWHSIRVVAGTMVDEQGDAGRVATERGSTGGRPVERPRTERTDTSLSGTEVPTAEGGDPDGEG